MTGIIGSWKGMDVIRVGKFEYNTSSEINTKKYIYAVYDLIGDGNTYLIRDNTIFAQLLNENGDISMIEEKKYYRPNVPKYYKPNVSGENKKVKFNEAKGEFVFNKEIATFKEDVIPKGTSKDMDRGKRATNKTVDDWIGFGMNATVEEILKGKK